MIKKLLKAIIDLFRRKPKPIELTGVSESWLRAHHYDSGKERKE